MRPENVQAAACQQDPRQALIDTKYFGIRPQPLEQYLYNLGLPQSCERVFWLHWDEGARNRNWISEIAISEVARRVRCDESSVVRAYQRLIQLGLLRRQNPGRDPSHPFRMATSLTEVLLPRQALGGLLNAPSRRRDAEAGKSAVVPLRAVEAQPAPAAAPEAPPAPTARETRAIDGDAVWKACLEPLRQELSDYDFKVWFACIQPYVSGSQLILFAPNNMVVDRLVKGFEGRLKELLVGEGTGITGIVVRVGNKPSVTAAATAAPVQRTAPSKAAPDRPRDISVFLQARTRELLCDLVPLEKVDELWRQILWSMHAGALRKLDLLKAMHTGLKLVRSGKWTKPNRMPPMWTYHHATARRP